MKQLILFFFILSLLSCSKSFVELEDTSSLNRQTYVKDLNTMEHFVNGVYLMLDRDFLGNLGSLYADIVSDNVKPVSLENPDLLAHYSWSQKAELNPENAVSSNSTAMNGEWQSSYQIIRSCDFVIEDINKYRNEGSEKSDNLKGQVYALRAMIHFKLMNIFAQPYSYSENATHIGIPYITNSDITKPMQRATVAENYNSVIADLQEAIRLMPEQFTDARLMNHLAAKALLARVYLFKQDYAMALKLAKDVYQKVPLMSIAAGYPEKMFTLQAPGKSEVLFQLSPVFIKGSAGIGATFMGAYLRFGQFAATNDITEILTENPDDIRLNWVTSIDGMWVVTKYPVGVAKLHPAPFCDYYQTIVRSSEVALTIAEAAAKTGDEVTSRELLNSIRVRANPLGVPLETTGTALLDSIYKERRKELSFEGLRMFDLQRLQQGVHRKDAFISGAANLEYPSNKAISPLPLQDVRYANLQQNKDY
ncbi:RagB/SusD family nutrient uptake outer membrane protein [Pseudoflavitalea sp. G-6-1-2]|uniref:RagB/SusD family nutrient uptake outer membrane protein n=1 Tax=Pseudoflavitalea sp. G-6-1-2 TaxID=2728841 RepID=UPI00146A0E3D|nr:RagB/SusD family nutrient uptake outer membrane protein [Pseudoflavitalea sp. G-6-1-2]NML22971.1 RagB/SusD family nutrient uptake outer membrane protein [Pseudoflavitalea sp. G-6-1-2]